MRALKKTFRRSRKDYPKGVLGIYDNKGKTIDRYTVVFEPFDSDGKLHFPYIGLSRHPFSPQGFGQHSELDFRYVRQSGEVVINFAELPEDCQKAVLQDLE